MSFTVQTGPLRYRTRLRPLWRIGQYIALTDLFFLLLFFLLLSSSVVRISGIRVNLPQAEKVPQAVGLGKAIVSVTLPEKPGMPCRIYFRDRQIAIEQLRRELISDNRKEKVLIIRADKEIPADLLFRVIGIAEAARMESFLAVQPLKSRSETRFE